MPVNAFNGTHNWGYDGVRLVRRARGVRRPAGLPALRRRLPRRRAWAWSRTSSTTTSARRATTCRCSGPTSRPGAQHLGRPGQPRRRGLGRGAPLHPRQRPDVARATTTSTGCGSTPCTRWPTPRRCTCSRSWRSRSAALSAHLRRPLTLIAESDLNDTRLVTPREAGGYGLDAQWSDDFHHAAARRADRRDHRLLRRLRAARRRWPRCASAGFFHDGTWSSFRGRDHGAPDRHRARCRPGGSWSCSQNHDQIGNRAAGDRLTEHLDDDQLACAALLTLCRAVHADAVHGRGVGGVDAVPVLHLPPRAGAREGDRRGPDRRVRRRWAGTPTRSPTRRTPRRSSARSWTGPSSPRAGTPVLLESTGGSRRCAASCRS